MGFIGVLFFILTAFILLKSLGLVFHAGIFMLTLPIKLLALGLAGLLMVFIFIPLGIVAGVASLIVLPAVIVGPFLPLLLLGGGLFLLLRNR